MSSDLRVAQLLYRCALGLILILLTAACASNRINRLGSEYQIADPAKVFAKMVPGRQYHLTLRNDRGVDVRVTNITDSTLIGEVIDHFNATVRPNYSIPKREIIKVRGDWTGEYPVEYSLLGNGQVDTARYQLVLSKIDGQRRIVSMGSSWRIVTRDGKKVVGQIVTLNADALWIESAKNLEIPPRRAKILLQDIRKFSKVDNTETKAVVGGLVMALGLIPIAGGIAMDPTSQDPYTYPLSNAIGGGAILAGTILEVIGLVIILPHPYQIGEDWILMSVPTSKH